MSGDANIIEVEHLDAGYPGVKVLEDVNFTVAKGEVFALLGGSGCGKSTIMKHLIGLNPAVAGKIRVDGLEMNCANRPAILRKIGVMYQSGALFGSMSVLENVMLPLEDSRACLPRRVARSRSCSLSSWGCARRRTRCRTTCPAA